MNWITFTEAYKKAGIYSTTAERRLKALKERKPALYKELVNDSVKPRLYKDPAFVEFIKHSTAKVNKKRRKSHPKPSKRSKSSKPYANNSPTQSAQVTIEDILDQPVLITMDEEIKRLYDQLNSEAERIIFEYCLKILDDYIFTPLTLAECCLNHGCNRQKFGRWRKQIEPIDHLYIRAKASRAREQAEEKYDEHLQNIHIAAKGYNAKLVTKDFRVHTDITGRTYRVQIGERETTKHISKNIHASIFWLTNKYPDEFKRTTHRQHQKPSVGYKDPLDEELENMTADELIEEYKRVEGLLSETKTKD